ncbi:MAG: helix-turn-helix transcriptional regulator [Christensenellaceae bacterium]|nr:helix-turn-helix transcriptional regulator [Christensenellaceae bacterium]
MEFREKLQELRKGRGLTQEELAEELFVSRTAVSKWESGRGYPGIDSLQELSRFFSVSIDELICPDEIITAARDEKRRIKKKYVSLICGLLDIFLVILLFIPVFGNGADSPASVSLFDLTAVSPWIKTVSAAVICITALNGIFGVIVSNLDRPGWDRHRIVTGIVLSSIGVVLFMLTRQPYAGFIYFALLAIKLFLAAKGR